MSFFRSNLAPRLRLLRTALFRRFIYADVVAEARDYGMDYLDVLGDIGPIDFAYRLFGPQVGRAPDFAKLIQPAERFTLPGAPLHFNSEPSVARFLGQLVYHRRASTVIELGCFVGWTTAHIACALTALGTGGHIYALDSDQDSLDRMGANLRRHGWSAAVTPVRGFSLDPTVLGALPRQADIIFLDTSHTYPETIQEVRSYAPRLAASGYFVLHDSINAPGVRRSLHALVGEFHLHTFATERSNGVTVLTRE